MNISLTPKLENMVRKKVESGLYGNASEVVREALRAMDDRDSFKRLQAAIAEGDADFERGDSYELTPALIEEMAREAVRKYEAGIEPNPDVCP